MDDESNRCFADKVRVFLLEGPLLGRLGCGCERLIGLGVSDLSCANQVNLDLMISANWPHEFAGTRTVNVETRLVVHCLHICTDIIIT